MKDLTTETSYLLERALFILQDGVCIVEKDATINYINSAAQDILEKPRGKRAYAGDNLLDFTTPEREELHREFISKAFDNEATSFVIEQEVNGQPRWFEILYYPIPDEGGNINHVCLKGKNVTEQVLLERKLQKERKDKRDKIIKATIEAQESERGMIGRELHDNVNQVLTTVKLYTELCYHDETANKELLKRSVQQINYCIEEIRSLSKRLAVPKSSEMNLKELIKDLIDTLNMTKKTSIEFKSFGIADREFSHELQTTIYRIIQEQLTNIIKYAHASSVKVIIAGTSNEIAVQVLDNGIGFDLKEKKRGNGITNMISRASIMGGTLKFETSPGNGCVMTAEFPFEKN